MKYLVIAESPAKKQKISGYLNTIPGHTFIVDASFGHIRYFKNGLKSIDIENNFKATYDIISSKRKVVKNLKDIAKNVDEVIIATDQDREGEAIGYHLIKVLGLDIQNTKRICFNEITKTAIIAAFNSPTTLDMDMFNAQQARSVLDLLIGYNISPLLWKAIQPRLSAGRCQSPALRLVCEREKEISDFQSNSSYELNAKFNVILKDKNKKEINTVYCSDIKSKDTTRNELVRLFPLNYVLEKEGYKTSTSNPPPPYITSTIQQDASSRFNMSPASTMSVLQRLYEGGKITYMRTDSIAVSNDFTKLCNDYIDEHYPGEFTSRTYKSKVANAQEAHECIRPVLLDITADDIEDEMGKKLYDMIWKRTLASFMPAYKEDIYTYSFVNKDDKFSFTLKKNNEFGYKKLYYNEFPDDNGLINNLKFGDKYNTINITATEKHTKPKSRFTEASLVKELEKMGIGRPSTFSSIVNTVLKREYVIKQTKDKTEKIFLNKLTISNNDTVQEEKFESKAPSQKGKLFPTNLGKIVNEFLIKHFDKINSYSFTSSINDKLDEISNGGKVWYDVVDEVYQSFIQKVKTLGSDNNIEITKKTVYKEELLFEKDSYKYLGYRDKYGVCAIRVDSEGNRKKIRLAKNMNLTDINEENVDEYFKYPIEKGSYNGEKVTIQKGPYGLYSKIDGKNISIEKEDISLDEIIKLLKQKNSKVIKEWKTIKILNGPYGPYIQRGNKRVAVPSDKDPNKLTAKACEEIVKNFKPKPYKKFGKFKKKNT